ncbi:hypothetical protein TELCIR_08275 [Teladorsagia circumcincta]|uniref:Reverse transcriptase domain-containing protein n=1 Tax=Teladorsagia circumcincta TaxID=45464 RepID=A0A2G9UIC6_TELCI|nr:hypothetical protein TELCIR_08275 [Teladorsagia circumcincta]
MTTKATLMLRADAIPVFKKKRPVPYANVAALDKEIDRLLAEDVLSPVTYSKWAAPIVVVKKANGTIRLCADYSTGLNDALMLHQHPLHTPDDVFTKLNGETVFTLMPTCRWKSMKLRRNFRRSTRIEGSLASTAYHLESNLLREYFNRLWTL